MYKAIARLINAILDAINRKNKSDAHDNAANTIANGNRVRESEQSYADMASKSRSNKAE